MYKIYSSAGCASCKAAKEFLAARNEEFEYLVLGDDYEVEDFYALAPAGFRSFPLILKDTEVIGTFKDLQVQYDAT